MQKIIGAIKSRTVWTIIGLVILNGVPSVTNLLPAGCLPYVNDLLGLLAIYFRVNPQQQF